MNLYGYNEKILFGRKCNMNNTVCSWFEFSIKMSVFVYFYISYILFLKAFVLSCFNYVCQENVNGSLVRNKYIFQNIAKMDFWRIVYQIKVYFCLRLYGRNDLMVRYIYINIYIYISTVLFIHMKLILLRRASISYNHKH